MILILCYLLRWYCHLDDDMYANVPVLVAALREAMNKSADGGVYFGRWPEEKLPKNHKGLRVGCNTQSIMLLYSFA